MNLKWYNIYLQEYADLASTPEHSPPEHQDHESLEKMYWKSLSFNNSHEAISTPIYAADIEDTVIDSNTTVIKLSLIQNYNHHFNSP